MSVVGIFQVPSSYELSWRDSIYLRALGDDWIIHEGEISGSLDATKKHLLVTSDFAQVTDTSVERWVVLGRPPAESAMWLQYVLRLDGDGGVILTSRVMSAVDFLARRGAEILDACSKQIEVPFLGSIERGGDEIFYTLDEINLKRSRQMLAHFDDLPARPNYWVKWSKESSEISSVGFEGSTSIDLTGRSRILLEVDFFSLSPGTWCVESEWDLSDASSAVDLEFRWGPYGDAASSSGNAQKSGRYRIDVSATWLNIAPAILTVSLVRPCFHGVLDLVCLRLRRLS